MIIVTTKTATIFINDKDVIKIDYIKEKGEVMVFYRGLENADMIEDVGNVCYVTDATPFNASEQNPDIIRENQILELEKAKLDKRSQHYRFQCVKSYGTLQNVLDICLEKEHNHKTAREKIQEIVEKCFVELDKNTSKAKKDGYL